jgi:hypothetical protein
MSARRQHRVGEFAFPDGETRRHKRDVETSEIGIDCLIPILEGIIPAFDTNRALLRRVFFLNKNKNPFVSIAFYPSMGYVPMVKFGGSKSAPIRLSEQQLAVLVELLPRLCDALCANEHYTLGIHDGFWIITTNYKAA